MSNWLARFVSEPDVTINDIPGPSTLENLFIHLDFIRDQFRTYRGIDEAYGPVSQFQLGPFCLVLVTDPDVIEEVLLRRADAFDKDTVTKELSVLLGRGLLLSEDDVWRRQRKMVAPSLQRRQIARYADVMVSETERMMADWEDGETRDIERDITMLALRIVVQALFSLDVSARLHEVTEAVDDAMSYLDERRHSPWRLTPDWLPNPRERQFDRAKSKLDSIIYDLIASRREGEPGDDLLYQLIAATDEGGDRMTDEQLRDEVITLFLAGHETTGLNLTYTWYLLAEHPRVAERLREEVDRVLGGGRAGVEDVSDLAYTEAVIRESLRLYSPAWSVGREATETVELEDWTIPEGAQVLMPQVLVHRDERWYDDPEAFRPERWLETPEDERPRFAYFPFGGGPRICVGNHFARMETILVVATLARHFTFENVSERELDTYASVTQRPETSVELRVSRREEAPAFG